MTSTTASRLFPVILSSIVATGSAATTVRAAGSKDGPPPASGDGIAAKHPRDAGIAKDPAVVFADDFEAWENGGAEPPEKTWSLRRNETSRTRTIPATEEVGCLPASGNRVLEIACWTTGSGSQVGGVSMKLGNYDHAREGLGDGHDEVWIRYYVKFDDEYRAVRNHGANLPPRFGGWRAVKEAFRFQAAARRRSKKDRLRLLVPLLAVLAQGPAAPQTGVLSSQVGYDAKGPKRALVRSDRRDLLEAGSRFRLVGEAGQTAGEGPVKYWGELWNAHWWVADFSDLEEEGEYRLEVVSGRKRVLASDPLAVRTNALWRACYPAIAFELLETRAREARTGKGWRDCGSDLQELSSHAVALDCLCDTLEVARERIAPEERRRLLRQLGVGVEYVVHLQDKARDLGLGEGPVVHEDRQDHVVTGNVAKAALALASASRLLSAERPDRSGDLLERAERAFAWIEEHGPVVNEEEPVFYPHVHGAPPGSRPPEGQWMTRDLLTMARAALELHRAGRPGYDTKAARYAARVLDRQVPPDESEDGLHGHFYLYDDFSSFGGARFTEKANVHCGAWSKDGRIYNKGGHYPHYLLALCDMLRLWPDHPDAARWRKGLESFARGYLLPACARSPFGILPAGYFRGEGLLFFSGWYHAHNNIYAFTASLALELERVLGDPRLREVAVANLQWVAGLNTGVLEEPVSGDASGRYLPVSMIWGVGARCRGSWTKIPGSICNGFAATPQFSVRPPRAETDLPLHLHDEAYIAHSLPYLAALARLVSYPRADSVRRPRLRSEGAHAAHCRHP